MGSKLFRERADSRGTQLSRAGPSINCDPTDIPPPNEYNNDENNENNENKPKVCSWRQALCISFLLCIIIAFAISYAFIGPSVITEPYDWIRSQGILGCVYLAIFHCFWILVGLPSSVLETLAGFMFGFFGGLITAFIGRGLGCVLAFLIGRRFGRQCAKALIERYTVLRAMDYAIRTEPKKIVFGIMLANMPIQVKSYGFALFDVTFLLWLLALSITGLPYLAAYVYFGMASNDILDVIHGGNFGRAELALTVVSGVVTVLGLIVVFIYGRRAVKQFNEAAARERVESNATALHEMLLDDEDTDIQHEGKPESDSETPTDNPTDPKSQTRPHEQEMSVISSASLLNEGENTYHRMMSVSEVEFACNSMPSVGTNGVVQRLSSGESSVDGFI